MSAPQFLTSLTPCNVPMARCTVPHSQASPRILLMRCGGLGDILLGTPLLAALREAYPNAHLTWIAERMNVQAIDANPHIDEILSWDGSYFKQPWRQFNLPL